MKKQTQPNTKMPVAMYGTDRELFEIALQGSRRTTKAKAAKPKASFLAFASGSAAHKRADEK